MWLSIRYYLVHKDHFSYSIYYRLLGSEDDDNEDDVNLVIHHDSDSAEEEKKGSGSRNKAIAEIDAESVLVKSVT